MESFLIKMQAVVKANVAPWTEVLGREVHSE